MNRIKRTVVLALMTGVALSGGGIANAEIAAGDKDKAKKATDCAKYPDQCAPPLNDLL